MAIAPTGQNDVSSDDRTWRMGIIEVEQGSSSVVWLHLGWQEPLSEHRSVLLEYHGLSVLPVEKSRHMEICFFVCGIPLDRVPMSSLPSTVGGRALLAPDITHAIRFVCSDFYDANYDSTLRLD